MGCDISFSADLNDPAGVASATVNWTAYDSTGTFTYGGGSANMTGPGGGGTWTALASTSYIPPNGYVAWSVNAVDTLQNQSSASAPNITVDSAGCGLG
jgi:hypothetical protein